MPLSQPAGNLSVCVVIPCYNHGAMVGSVLAQLASFALPCFIMDDGSNDATRLALEALAAAHGHVTLVRLPDNGGKGAAVLAGLALATRAGYSHALQVDADGQHCLNDVPALLALAQQHPQALISGRPAYDASVPRSRLYGRYVTHVWVWIETLSFSLKDSMCGFRVYPLSAVNALLAHHVPGRRMDFDIEIMVRLYWQGTPSYFVPTRVSYPENGLSHFDALRDNLRISWMHTKLFFGMLPRIPRLLAFRRQQHWADVPERRGSVGMRFMLGIYRVLGRSVVELLLHPVIAYFWLTGRAQRQASQIYLTRLRHTARENSQALPPGTTSYRHFLRFGSAMLDKVASWRGDLRLGKDVVFAAGAEALIAPSVPAAPQPGKLILASHLGDIEVCRALAQQDGRFVINALVFSKNAQRFKKILEDIAPQAGVNLIPVTDIGPDTAMVLKQKLEAGEWVAIVGDRTAVQPQRGGVRRVVWSRFLGELAPFPQGHFVLAAVLRCPVLLMFALRQQGRLVIHCEHFSDAISLPRLQRAAALQAIVDRYAARLEHHVLQAPLDWFNFFDFWRLPDAVANNESGNTE